MIAVCGNSSRIRRAGLETLGRVGRRHPDVDDDELGPVLPDELDQLMRVPALSYDLEARALEQPRQTLTKQNFVICQRHPDPAWGHAGKYGCT
jgi:hypothetical protein